MLIDDRQLKNKGYSQIDTYTYVKEDKDTGMTVELEFNSKATREDNKKIENSIINTLIRQGA